MKKKVFKIFSVLLAVLLITASLPLASTAQVGQVYEDELTFRVVTADDGSTYAEFVKYTGNDESLVIPDTFNGLPVKAIGDEAFLCCKELVWLEIPDSVETIGNGSFQECTKLYSVKMPASLRSLGSKAFYYCRNLPSLDLPDGLQSIGSYAFAHCCSLTALELPDTLKTIGRNAFDSCAVTELRLPESLEKLSYQFIINTDITSLTLPKNMKDVSVTGSLYNQALETVVFPGYVENIEWDNIFYQTTDLTECHYPETLIFEHSLPADIFDDGWYMEDFISDIYDAKRDSESGNWILRKKNEETAPTVYNQNGTFEYIINENGEAVVVNYARFTVDYTGRYCLTVPSYFTLDGVKITVGGIGAEAFRNRVGLRGLTLPDTVKTIGPYAFEGCSAMASVNIPEGVEIIEAGAFMNTAVTEIDIPESVRIIGTSAFEKSKASTVTGGENVEVIEPRAFYSASIQTPFFGEKLRIIDHEAFHWSALKGDIIFSASLKMIGDNAFARCSFLTSVFVPDSVTYIGASAFLANTGLSHISLSEKITKIPDYMFYQCYSLREIELPESVSEIGVAVFDDCSSLETVNIPGKVKKIQASTFRNCGALEKIDLPERLESIGYSAFERCNSLTELTIPDSVKTLEKRSFYSCASLESVYMSKNVSVIPNYGFDSCESLVNFEWDAPEQIISDFAFFYCSSLKEFDFSRVIRLYPNSFWGSGITYAYIGIEHPTAENAYKAIELATFKECGDLETVSIGGSINEIQSEAFASCESLSTVMISESVTTIADDAFADSPNVTFVCTEVSYAYSYASANGIPVSTLVIDPIPNQTYRGSAIRPEVTVTLKGERLEKNSDFSVSYTNNINAGTAKVKISGKGDYGYLSSTANFTIVTRSIKTVEIKEISDQPHTGSAVEPNLTLIFNGKKLKEGTDYRLYYYDNKDVGTASVIVSGTGNFSSSQTVHFEIRSMDASEVFRNFLLSVFDFILTWIGSVFIIR